MTTSDSSDHSKSSSGGEDNDSPMDKRDDVSPVTKVSENGKQGVAAKKTALSSKATSKTPAKRGRKKRPKDMPQRPLSAYNLFFRAEREEIIKSTAPETIISTAEAIRGPEAGSVANKKQINLFQALAVLISKKWKSLGPQDRTSYDKMAKEEMAAYRKKLGDYQMQLVRKSMSENNGELNDVMKEDSGKGSSGDSKLKRNKISLSATPILAGIGTAPPKHLGGPTDFNSLATGAAASAGPTGGMFSSFQAQLNAGQLSGARLSQGDQVVQSQLPTAGSQLGAAVNANPGLSQLALQQQMSSVDPFLQGHFDSQQGFNSVGAGMPSYFQELMLAQQQQLGQFGMQQQQQGEFMQRLQALQQQVPQGSQGFSSAGLDQATASLYGLTQGFPSAGGSSGLTPDLQAFLQQQQQQQQAPAPPPSANGWNPALLPSANQQRSGGPTDWSYLLNAGGGDANSLTAIGGGMPAASGGASMGGLAVSGTTSGGGASELASQPGAATGNNSDQLSDVLRMFQQQQQLSFRQGTSNF